jgi:GntR family transcriptional regulator, transcriptional repressor for pyruvate dehydrogenase complex
MKENETYHINHSPRMFEQVTKQIMNFIHSEQISKGSKIPTERNLSELLEVSRSSIREGIRILELLGYLDSRQGEGTFVSNSPPFLIPSRVLNQQLDSNSLKNYYDIFLMCSEQIVMSLLYDDKVENHFSCNKNSLDPIVNFWADFANWIKFLGTQLTNPLLLSLWLNTYELLLENKFFLHFNPTLHINAFVDNFLEKNKMELMALFKVLSTVN